MTTLGPISKLLGHRQLCGLILYYIHLRPYDTRNLLFSGMIFKSSQVVFRIENLGEKYHLVPSSSVLGAIVGSKLVFNPNLLKMLVIFLKIENFLYFDENG